jgi:hypothetical protein
MWGMQGSRLVDLPARPVGFVMLIGGPSHLSLDWGVAGNACSRQFSLVGTVIQVLFLGASIRAGYPGYVVPNRV